MPVVPPAGPALVRAAGGVLWRPAAEGVEVAVVHRPRYDDWSLPKGKLDDGEPAVVAAWRELQEETGWTGVVGRTLGTTGYRVEQGVKCVWWWSVRAVSGAFTPSDEVDVLRWLAPQDAAALLTRASDVEVLQRFTGSPPLSGTLLVLRHGRAGSRAAWHGDDADRPLDDLGRRQAQAVARALRAYGVRRLVAAPLARCVMTLQPLAEQLGLPVETDEAAGARGWADDPDGVVRMTRGLAAGGVPAVVCSQGEVVPGLVGRLTAGSATGGDHLRSDKGSLWSLSFDSDGVVVDADYTDTLLG